MKFRHVLLALPLVAVLAACGSSSDDSPAPPVVAPPPVVTAPPEQLPSSATQSVAGLIAFATQQVATPRNDAEPLLLGDAPLPVDNTGEPVAI